MGPPGRVAARVGDSVTSRATNGPQTAVDRERGAVRGEPAGAGQYAPGQVAQGHAGEGRAEYGDQRLVAPEQPVGDRPGEEGERAEDHGEDPAASSPAFRSTGAAPSPHTARAATIRVSSCSIGKNRPIPTDITRRYSTGVPEGEELYERPVAGAEARGGVGELGPSDARQHHGQRRHRPLARAAHGVVAVAGEPGTDDQVGVADGEALQQRATS